MGHIKEPKGVDLIVAPSILTEQDKKMISDIIANYKRTGKKNKKTATTTLRERIATRTKRKKVLVKTN